MRYVFLTFVFAISYILESTIFIKFPVAGVKPNLILIFVVFYALLKGPREGALAGLIGGFLQDVLLGNFIGLNLLPMVLTGVLVGFLEKKVYKENFFIPIVSVLAATMIQQSLVYLLGLSIKGFPGNYLAVTIDILLPMAIYNSCLAPFLYGRFFKSAHKGLLRQPDY